MLSFAQGFSNWMGHSYGCFVFHRNGLNTLQVGDQFINLSLRNTTRTIAKVRVLRHCLRIHAGETERTTRLDNGEVVMKRLLVSGISKWIRASETSGMHPAACTLLLPLLSFPAGYIRQSWARALAMVPDNNCDVLESAAALPAVTRALPSLQPSVTNLYGLHRDSRAGGRLG